MQIREINIVPVGPVDQNVLDYLILFLPSTFNVPCALITPTVHTADAYDPNRRQYSSPQLLAKLLEINTDKNAKILGVTDLDLFIPVLTFVFGQAQFSGRVALFSAHRLHPKFYGLPEDRGLLYSRCEKEASHELGHTTGLAHCRRFDCVMHVSNSVDQVDLKGSRFCSTCASAIRRN